MRYLGPPRGTRQVADLAGLAAPFHLIIPGLPQRFVKNSPILANAPARTFDHQASHLPAVGYGQGGFSGIWWVPPQKRTLPQKPFECSLRWPVFAFVEPFATA